MRPELIVAVALTACHESEPAPPPASAPVTLVRDAAAPDAWLVDAAPQVACWTGIPARVAHHDVPDPAGKPVSAEALTLADGCPEPVRDRAHAPTGLSLFASSSEFLRAFHCNPAVALEPSRRLAVVRFRHLSSEFVSLQRVVEDGDHLVLVLHYEAACQGIEPSEELSTIAASVPKTPERVEVITCAKPRPPCPRNIP